MAERKQIVNLRMWQEDIDAMDERAAEHGVDRSEFIRRSIAYASRKMPQGWEPPAPKTAPVKAATTRGLRGKST